MVKKIFPLTGQNRRTAIRVESQDMHERRKVEDGEFQFLKNQAAI
jgi:hypothetical protein